MKKIQTVCVFGSSSESIDKEYLDSAEHLGKTLAEHENSVVFGGGRYGVMGAVARGVTAGSGKLIGVSPKFFIKMGVLFDDATEMIYTETMRERKAVMEDTSDAFIICAGGIGTFEEFFEVLTLKQLGRHSKAIVIYNVNGFYTPLLQLMQSAMDDRFLAQDTSTLYSVVETEDEVFALLEGYEHKHYDKYRRN